jgi:REP element-mobilizing transposase RayT
MARPIRIEFEDAAYHVTSRGNERKEIFNDDRDRSRFLDTLGECCERFGLVVHGYCLMPNHYHLLAQTPRANLSRAIGWLQTTYCIRYNRRYKRSGHLVQGRFKAHLIQQDAYARQLLRYVHLNPVRPKERRKPVPLDRKQFFEVYRWSSHRAYAGTARASESPQWLCTEWLVYWGKRKSAAVRSYVADLNSCFGKEIQSPLKDLRGGLVLGDESLWKKAKKILRGRAGAEELRWLKRDNDAAARKRVADLIGREGDRRVRIWARVRLAGEPLVAIARELGYADGTGVLRVVQRLDAASETDRNLRQTLERLKKAVMS